MLLMAVFLVATSTCPAVTAPEVTAALRAIGEDGTWAVEGNVQPYPNTPYYECHYRTRTGTLNREVLIQVRPTDASERTSIRHFVDQVSRTALVAPQAVAGLGDEAWFYVANDGIGQLNVRSGQAVVHVAVDLQTKTDGPRKLDAAKAVAAHALARLKSGEISVAKK